MKLTDGFMVRRASVADAATIVHHRRAMCLEMRPADEAALNEMAARFAPWVEEKIEADEYLGWFAVAADGAIAAGAGLWLLEWPPHFMGRAPRARVSDECLYGGEVSPAWVGAEPGGDGDGLVPQQRRGGDGAPRERWWTADV